MMVQRIDVSSWTGNKEIILDRKGMRLEIFGAFQVFKNDKKSLRLTVRHAAPDTYANTVLKGVAFDHASLELDGTIVVERNAVNTNSFLKENILLISPSAFAQAIPNLEILTDQVKCSHAATISTFPEEHLFYLQSRGLNKKQAETLFVEAFLSDVVSRKKSDAEK